MLDANTKRSRHLNNHAPSGSGREHTASTAPGGTNRAHTRYASVAAPQIELGEAELHDPLTMSVEELRAFGYSDADIAAVAEQRGGRVCDVPAHSGELALPDVVAQLLASGYAVTPTARGYRLRVDPLLGRRLRGLTFSRVRLALVTVLLSDLLEGEIDPMAVAGCVDAANRVRSNVPNSYADYDMAHIRNDGELWVDVPHDFVEDTALALGTRITGMQTARRHLWAVALEHVLGRAIEEAPLDEAYRERLRAAWAEPPVRAHMVATLIDGVALGPTFEHMRYQFDTSYELYTGARLPDEQDLYFYDWSYWTVQLPLLLVSAEARRAHELAESHELESRQNRYDRRRPHVLSIEDPAQHVFRALHAHAGQTYDTSDLFAGRLAVGDRVTLTGGREVVIIELPGDVRYVCEAEGVVYRQSVEGFCDELLFGTLGQACESAAAIAGLAETLVDFAALLIVPIRGPFLIAQLAGTALYVGNHYEEIAAAWRYFGEVKTWFDANAPEVLVEIVSVLGIAELVRAFTVELDPDLAQWARVAARALGDALYTRGRGAASGIMARLQPLLDRMRTVARRMHLALAAIDTVVGVEVSFADIRASLEAHGIDQRADELAAAVQPSLRDRGFREALLLLSNTLGGLMDALGGGS